MCCAQLIQSCLTLCNPMDCSRPGSSVQGILQTKYWSGLPCPPPGDLPNQRWNLNLSNLLHWQVVLCQQCHLGSHIYLSIHVISYWFLSRENLHHINRNLKKTLTEQTVSAFSPGWVTPGEPSCSRRTWKLPSESRRWGGGAEEGPSLWFVPLYVTLFLHTRLKSTQLELNSETEFT